MTKQQYVDKCVLALLECDTELVKETTVRIIRNTKNLTYEGTNDVIPLSYQIDILKEIKKKLSSASLIKEAQESAMFTQSIDAVMEYLKPSVQTIQTEINELSEKKDLDNEKKV